MFTRGKYNQAKCPNCQGWHFAITLDEKGLPKEYKCCQCKTPIEKLEKDVKLLIINGEWKCTKCLKEN